MCSANFQKIKEDLRRTFVEAIKSVFTKYAVFEGRARRSEYWWFVLAYAIVNGLLSGIATATGLTIFTIISSIVALACLSIPVLFING